MVHYLSPRRQVLVFGIQSTFEGRGLRVSRGHTETPCKGETWVKLPRHLSNLGCRRLFLLSGKALKDLNLQLTWSAFHFSLSV